MNEQQVRDYVANALSQVVDEAEVRVVRRGIMLEFLDGEKFLIPTPVDVGDGSPDEDENDDEDEEDEETDADDGFMPFG